MRNDKSSSQEGFILKWAEIQELHVGPRIAIPGGIWAGSRNLEKMGGQEGIQFKLVANLEVGGQNWKLFLSLLSLFISFFSLFLAAKLLSLKT